MFRDPAIEKDFFDREKISQLLKKRLSSLKEGYRQNIAIIGTESMGKTSQLYSFISESKEEDCLPIYLEIRQEPFMHFSNRFMGAVLFHFSKTVDGISRQEIRTLIKESQKKIPKTVTAMRVIRKLVAENEYDQAFQRLFELLGILRNETDKYIIIILDEFHNLNDFKIREPFSELGKKIMIQKDILYIVASSRINLAKKILSEKLNLLFGNFEIIKLGGFNYNFCLKFIEGRLGALKLSERLKSFLASFTSGNPFYLDAVLKSVNSVAVQNKSEKISVQGLCQAIEECLFDSSGTLYNYFLRRLEMLPEENFSFRYKAILLAVSDNNNKLNLIVRTVRRNKKETSRLLSKLIEIDLLQKNGVFYRLPDKLFKFWLKFVYGPRLFVLGLDLKSAREKFRKDIEKRINDFSNEAKKDLYERITELFRSFRNEVVEIDQRKLKLPNFLSVEPKMIENKGPYIIASNNTQNWICQIRPKHVSENDLTELLSSGKSKNGVAQKKVLVTLNGLEDGANLLSKEKGILTLNLKNLNILMDVFGKEQLVIPHT